jgi:RNA polymerase sigma-70 factor (ECF subfamily)
MSAVNISKRIFMVFNIHELFILRRFLAARTERGFNGLYDKHTLGIFSFAMQLTGGNRLLSAEIVRDAWGMAIEKLPSLLSRSGLKHALYEIVVNCSREYYHRQQHYMLIHENAERTVAAAIPGLNKPGENPDIERALALLPLGYRHVFVLHDLRGYDHAEIASLLRMSEGSSKQLLFNARQSLYQLLQVPPPANGRRISEWRESGRKEFRSAYACTELPNGLRSKVVNYLFENGLIIPQARKAHPYRSIRWLEFYVFGNKLTHQ